MDEKIKKKLLTISAKNEKGIPLTISEELFEATIIFGKENAQFVVDGLKVKLPDKYRGKGIIGTP